MRVGLELTVLGLDPGGSARHARAVAAELRARPDCDVVELAHRARGGRIAAGLERELLWFPAALPRRARRARLDVLHCLSPLATRRSPVPLVVTIHDVLPWVHPEWLTKANVLQHRLVVEPVVRRGAVVCVPSEFTRGELVSRIGVDPARVVVTPNGVDGAFTPGPGPADRREPYVLTVGTFQPRKDLDAALAAFERVVDRGLPHRLVVVGARGWGERPPRSAERIDVAGYVGEDELVALYRGASCLLLPSRYEGFGLPAVEAMACGTPVVARATSALPEIVGDAGVLVDPGDADGLGAALVDVLGDEARARALRDRGLARAGEFTWRRCADRVLDAYRVALS